MAAIEPTTAVHRIGGASLANLALKPSEATSEPPGFSVLLGGTPHEAADQMRRVFPDPRQFARLHAQSVIVASATVEEIRLAGFDVISVATGRFPNHGRVTHGAGAAGFTPENLAQLHAILRETPTPGE